jgi:hypothetical protein
MPYEEPSFPDAIPKRRDWLGWGRRMPFCLSSHGVRKASRQGFHESQAGSSGQEYYLSSSIRGVFARGKRSFYPECSAVSASTPRPSCQKKEMSRFRLLKHFDACDVRQRTDRNAICFGVHDNNSRLRQCGTRRMSNLVDFIVGEMDRERLERLTAQQLSEILCVHAPNLTRRRWRIKDRFSPCPLFLLFLLVTKERNPPPILDTRRGFFLNYIVKKVTK